jgi:hypothetical protein
MTALERLNATRPPSILLDVVCQHAKPNCARTPITAVTTAVRTHRTELHLVNWPEPRTPEPSLPDTCSSMQAICRPLKSHR